MSTIEVHGPHDIPQGHAAEQTTKEWVAGGSAIEAFGGIAAVVLAIVALATMDRMLEITRYLAAIATLAVGVALFCEGAAVMHRAHRLLAEAAGGRLNRAELGGGMTVEFLGGIAGIVLGILALLNVAPAILMAVGAIAMGAALMLSSGTTGRINHLSGYPTYGSHETTRMLSRELVEGAAGAQVLVGLAGVVLGIIALSGVYPMTLLLVAMLCLGGSALLTGGALAERMFSLMTR